MTCTATATDMAGTAPTATVIRTPVTDMDTAATTNPSGGTATSIIRARASLCSTETGTAACGTMTSGASGRADGRIGRAGPAIRGRVATIGVAGITTTTRHRRPRRRRAGGITTTAEAGG